MDVNSVNHICVGKLNLVELAGSEKVAKKLHRWGESVI